MLCPEAWTTAEFNVTVDEEVLLYVPQTVDFSIKDPDESTADCPIIYELSEEYPFVNKFIQHTHETFSIEFESDQCEFHFDKVPLVTVKAKSVCRVDEKKINIQL